VAALALTAFTAEGGQLAFSAEAPQPGAGDTVTAQGVQFRTAVPGENGLPAVKITNTGDKTVQSVDIKTVTLDSWALSWPYTEIRSDKDGSLVKRCGLDTGNRKVMRCGKVTLNLPPKQSLTLRTEVSTDERLKPGELPRTVWNVNGKNVTAELTMVESASARSGGE
jgi:hypothetical protein